ncbi:retropepsin-like aspartic protease [Polaribacter sp.]|uniref:retropepsin-like aspartic protease n=1 Tax=Polaribacter sp. TaxID=1920175 RepID=UPI003F6B0562
MKRIVKYYFKVLKKQVLFLLLIVLIPTGFAQNRAAFQDTIPFKTDLGLIIIPITFNGVEKQFAFDTGATHSVAYDWAKNELKPTRKTTNITSSSGLKSKMRFYKSGLIELGSRKIRKHSILNTAKNEVFSCYKIDGILGVDIIKELNWTIDFERKILVMYPSNHFPDKVKKMHPLTFSYHDKRPYVFLKRNNKKIRFLLDTGAGGFSNISKREYNFSTIDNYPNLSTQSASMDVNGILTSSLANIVKYTESVSGDVTISPIIVYNNQKSSKIANQLWRNNELFLSLKKDKLYSFKANINNKYKGYPCSVLFFKNKMRIVKVDEESDLWQNGVRQGTEILSINGKKFDNFCDLDNYFRKTVQLEQSFKITLANGSVFTVNKNSILKK